MHSDVMSTIIISLCKQLRAGELSATDQYELSKFIELTSELIVEQDSRIKELESNLIYCNQEIEILKKFITMKELGDEFIIYWRTEWFTHIYNFIQERSG
ncbi:hypothetical protein D7Z26_06415 [Cohnella endophytica]|uniref:Uncharacterized protein n=1 Tax=Cohnella endophytica TaxID=2419778 RepID=A0A494Y475_9BACL|nr:hypothetical protein [Cohnella endophytica]RKP56265.1 hypothetical protein D7Z26_06415 [Cohnella endophytica]